MPFRAARDITGDLGLIPTLLFVEFTGSRVYRPPCGLRWPPCCPSIDWGFKTRQVRHGLTPGLRFFVLYPRVRVQLPNVPPLFLENLKVLASGKFGFPVGLGFSGSQAQSFRERWG